MSTPNIDEPQPDADDLVARVAHVGSQAWRRAVHIQQTARPDHSGFYPLAGELADTLRCLDSLVGLLAGQVAAYPGTVASVGARVYDDEGAVPQHRLRSAVLALAETRHALTTAERAANRFWSAISHIGVHPIATPVAGSEVAR